MKTFFTLDEVLSASQGTLTLLDIKDYCRQGYLHPCVYFDGNIVCFEDERNQESIDKRDSFSHCVKAKWHLIFEGYIHNKDFINILDTTEKSYFLWNIDNIVVQYSNTEIPDLSLNQSLRAYERRYDDDIKDFHWEKDFGDKDYQGIEYSTKEIVFHIKELNQIHFDDPERNEFESLKAKYKLDNYQFFLFSKPLLTIHEAACIVSLNNPVFVEIYKDHPNFAKYFQHYIHAFNLIHSWIKAGNLKQDDEVISSEDFKQALSKNTIHVQGYNANIVTMFENELTVEHKRINEQIEEIKQLKDTIKKLHEQIEQLLAEQSSESTKPYNLLDLISDETDHERYAPDLAFAVQLWISEYVNNPKADSHNNKANIWIKKNTPYNGEQDDTSTRRLRDITSPYSGWRPERKKLLTKK